MTSVVGVVVFALLIGLVTDNMAEFVEDLRRGESHPLVSVAGIS